MKFRVMLIVLGVSLLVFCLSGCNASPTDGSGLLNVVTTTTILGDVVNVIGGDEINLTILLPPDTDPHSFQPNPRDLAIVSDADVVFLNGLGLEEFLEDVIENAVEDAQIVGVSEGVETISVEEGDDHDHGEANPHVWMDPNNVIVWAENIAETLCELDPENAESYATNAESYIQELKALDAWIIEQIENLPEENRKLVTDHDTFAYFIDRYGFELVGTINPGYSTLAEPSAQDIAALEDQIRDLGVPAVFVGRSVNPNLAERIAEDTGVELVYLYTGSLSGEDGPAPTYLEMMRYDVGVMIEGLGGSINITLGERIPFPDEWLEIADSMNLYIGEFNKAISPNGKWMVDTSWDNAIDGTSINDVHIIPLSNPNMKIEVQNDGFYGNYLFPDSWSPDSSAIAIRAADEGRAGCPFTRVLVYRIDPNSDSLTQYVFDPYEKDDDPPGCIVTSWSPDSSMLAVTFSKGELFILDQEANLIQMITLDIKYPSFVNELIWITSNELGYIAGHSDIDESRTTQYEVRMVSLGEPTQEHILFSSPTNLGIVDSTTNPSRLLISDMRHYPQRKFTWVLINTETNKVEQSWEMCHLFGVASEGLQKDYLALYRKPIEPGNEEICEEDVEKFLWVYDWDTGELLNYGKIGGLKGWNTKYGRFIVSEDDTDADEPIVVIVKP